VYAGVRVDQNALRGEALSAVAGDRVAMIEMAVFSGVKFDQPIVIPGDRS
jgi:hypothetical protein